MPGGRYFYRTANVENVAVTSRQRIGRKAKKTARDAAPFLTGHLRRNIHHWVVGDQLRVGDRYKRVPYMRRQEFTHKTKRGFLRKGMQSVRPDIASSKRAARIRDLRRRLTRYRDRRDARAESRRERVRMSSAGEAFVLYMDDEELAEIYG